MDDVDKEFIEMYQNIGTSMGFDDLMITLFAKIYIEPEEIAMEELAKKTGYSLASVSNKLKSLEAMGIIKRTKKPGSKKIFLYSEKSFVNVLKYHLVKKEENVIRIVKAKAPEIIKKCKNKAKSEKEKKKLKILEDYYGQIVKFERVISDIKNKIKKMDV